MVYVLLLLLLMMMVMVRGALTSLSFDVCAVAFNFPIVIGIVIISTQDGQQDAF